MKILVKSGVVAGMYRDDQAIVTPEGFELKWLPDDFRLPTPVSYEETVPVPQIPTVGEDGRIVPTPDKTTKIVKTRSRIAVGDADPHTYLDAAWRLANYAGLRRMEYPPMEDYLDAVAKGDDAGVEAYKAACMAVKAKYPKPAA